eukprot:7856409-Pyramimonas_sp.AAC.1
MPQPSLGWPEMAPEPPKGNPEISKPFQNNISEIIDPHRKVCAYEGVYAYADVHDASHLEKSTGCAIDGLKAT